MAGTWFGNEPRYNFSGGTGEQSCVWSVAQPKINSWESRANLLSEAVPSKFFMVDLLGLGKPDDEKLCGQFVAESQHDGYANDPRCGLLMIARHNRPSPRLFGVANGGSGFFLASK